MVDRNIETLKKLIKHTDRILTACEDISYEDFVANLILADGIMMNFIQLGECVNKFDDGFKEANKEISWAYIRGLRNRSVHDYEGIDYTIVWAAVKNDLPILKEQLEKLIVEI